MGALLFSACSRSGPEATPAASLDKARAAQDALLRYLDRVNVYDASSAVGLSTPDHAEKTRSMVTAFQERQITRKPDRVTPPDQCADTQPCRIKVSGQVFVRGQVSGSFNSEYAMAFSSGRWLVADAVGEDIPPGP